MKTKLFITAAALMVFTVLASAQDKAANQGRQNTSDNRGAAWVDANNDGICDNLEARKSENFKGKGQCDMRGAGQGKGQGQGAGMGPRGMGPCGMGQGRGNGNGKGSNFVDANNNGICDFRETPAKK